MPDTATVWLTRAEAADYLRVSVATLDRLADDGSIPRHRALGRRAVRFRRDELDRFGRKE